MTAARYLRPPTGLGARRAFTASGVVALLVAVSFVWHSAYANFTAVTTPSTVAVSTGTVVLNNNHAGSAVFAVRDLKPGVTETRCVLVTSTGSVPTTVKLYGGGRTQTSLAHYLSLAIDAGTGGGPTGGCAGFIAGESLYSGALEGFTASSFATGLGSWMPTGNVNGESRTFRLTYSLPADTSTSAQDSAATFTLTWEAQVR